MLEEENCQVDRTNHYLGQAASVAGSVTLMALVLSWFQKCHSNRELQLDYFKQVGFSFVEAAMGLLKSQQAGPGSYFKERLRNCFANCPNLDRQEDDSRCLHLFKPFERRRLAYHIYRNLIHSQHYLHEGLLRHCTRNDCSKWHLKDCYSSACNSSRCASNANSDCPQNRKCPGEHSNCYTDRTTGTDCCCH